MLQKMEFPMNRNIKMSKVLALTPGPQPGERDKSVFLDSYGLGFNQQSLPPAPRCLYLLSWHLFLTSVLLSHTKCILCQEGFRGVPSESLGGEFCMNFICFIPPNVQLPTGILIPTQVLSRLFVQFTNGDPFAMPTRFLSYHYPLIKG